MQWSLLGRLPSLDGVSSISNQEGSGKSIPTQDGQMEEAVPFRVQVVQVTLMADKSVGYSLVTVE